MNKLHDLVRMIFARPKKSVRKIATALSVSKSSVHRYRNMIRDGGFTLDKLESMELDRLDALFNQRDRNFNRAEPDFTGAEKALSQKGVNRILLWEDYCDLHGPRALSYSRFAHRYRQHRRSLNVVMRQHHQPGETVFVDFSGARPTYIDPGTGRTIAVELFIGVLGASNYTFAYCVPTQSELDWIDANTRMLEYFGGTPQIIVPDNLRAAVMKAGRDGVLQRVYQQFAEHYRIAVHPARPYKPRDKGKAEKAVQFAQTRLLGKMRHHSFHSLAEINAAMAPLLEAMNARSFQRMPDSRRDRFLALDLPALRPLPSTRFIYKEWTARQRVPKDYHIKIFEHDYSVPFALSGRFVEASVSSEWVEIFCDHQRVARHARSTVKGGHTTDMDHQPPNHRAQAERTRDGFTHWAHTVGPNTQWLVAQQFQGKVPLQGLPSCDAFKNLAHKHGASILERAAGEAMAASLTTVSAVKHYIKQPPSPSATMLPHPAYTNVRGGTAYELKAAA